MEKFRLSGIAHQARNRTDTAIYNCDAHEHLGNMHRYNAAAAHSIFTGAFTCIFLPLRLLNFCHRKQRKGDLVSIIPDDCVEGDIECTVFV